MDEIGARLTRLMFECFTLKRELEAESPFGADSGNAAEQLLAALPEDGTAIPLGPYAEIIPNLSIGYEAGTGAKIEARRSPAAPPEGPFSLEAAEIAVVDIGASRWLTIEYIWDWSALTAKGSAHLLFEADALPATTIRPKLRLQTAAGDRCDIDSGQFRIGRNRDIQMASLILPNSGVEFDYSVRPTIIMFLDPTRVVLNVSRLFVW